MWPLDKAYRGHAIFHATSGHLSTLGVKFGRDVQSLPHNSAIRDKAALVRVRGGEGKDHALRGRHGDRLSRRHA